MTMPERLGLLATSAPSMPPALRQRVLASLTAALHQDCNSLLYSPPSTSGQQAPFAANGSWLPEMAQAAWKLAAVAGELEDDGMAAFAGLPSLSRCMACLQHCCTRAVQASVFCQLARWSSCRKTCHK